MTDIDTRPTARSANNTRVAITIPGHIVDLTLSPTVPISHIVSQLIPYLRQQLNGKPKAVEFLSNAGAYWHLERFGNVALDSSKTLEDEGVLDGEALYLKGTYPTEKYPALIDDVAESIAYHQKSNFPMWRPESGIRLNLTLIQIIGGIIAGVLGLWASRSQPPMDVRYVVVGICAAPAVTTIAVGLTVLRPTKERLYEIVRPLFVVGYEMITAVGLLAIPRKLDVYQLVVAAALLFVVSVLVYAISGTRRDAQLNYSSSLTEMSSKTLTEVTKLNYGVAAAALIVLIVSGANLLYLSPPAVIGVEIIVLAFFAVLMASRVALAFAKINLPYVPATGEEYTKVSVDDVGSATRSAGSKAVDSILNQEQQVITAYGVIVGILSGALSLIVATAFFTGKFLDNHQWIIWSFILVISAALVYRGKSYDDERLQRLCLAASAGTMTAFLAGLVVSPTSAHNDVRFFLTLAALMMGLMISSTFSIQRRVVRSPIAMRGLEIIEMVLYATPIVYLVLALDLYQKVRAR